MRRVSSKTSALFFATLSLGLFSCTPTGPSPTPPASGAPAATATAAPTAAPQGSGTRAAPAPSNDTLSTSAGDVKITPVYHGTVMLEHKGQVIVVDPWGKGPIDKLPKADLILITDIHFDHMDKDAIAKLKKSSTILVAPEAVAKEVTGAKVLKNGEKTEALGIPIEAIPMYNKVRGPEAGKLFHDKGRGNGYVLTFGDKRVYLSGDTECTEEMRGLQSIDVAFVCMNLPYTMPPSEAAECIKGFRPKVVYPYHYRESNLADLTKVMEGEKGIEVRLRSWY